MCLESCNSLGLLMEESEGSQVTACQYGEEAEGEATEEIEHHIGVMAVLHQRGAFVHERGKSGEAAAEACGEQELGGGRHPSVAVPVKSRQETDDEASQHIDRHSTKGEGDDGAGLHHLRHPISQSASEEAAHADQ